MTTYTLDQLRHATGHHPGHSEWMRIEQSHIDLFADVVDDHQWIHTDVERASRTAQGTTIAHGYLTLAVAGTRLGELLEVTDAQRIINYGIDRARFPAALPAGSRVRTHASIVEVTEVNGGVQVRGRVSAEAEGVERPVCVADVQIRYLR
jgi:acyl dehydratase